MKTVFDSEHSGAQAQCLWKVWGLASLEPKTPKPTDPKIGWNLGGT